MVDLLTHREASDFPLPHLKIKKKYKKPNKQRPICSEHDVNLIQAITENYKRSCTLIALLQGRAFYEIQK